jgi:hypothetical protein
MPRRITELNGRSSPAQTVSGNVPSYLEFKAHWQVKTLVLEAHLNRLYIQKATQRKRKMLEQSGLDGSFTPSQSRALQLHKPYKQCIIHNIYHRITHL